MPTVADALAAAAQAGLSRIDARALLRSASSLSDTELIAFREREIAGDAWQRYTGMVARRAAGEPIAYLTGTREFYGLELHVTPAVLIPRPETELLVEWALERMPVLRPCRVLDLGTGSGAIAIAIAHKRRNAEIVATDISQNALAVARANAERRGVAHVQFVQSDWFTALAGQRFDIILSNPPYVAAGDPHLGQGDLRFEPPAALSAGADGMASIRTIAATARDHMTRGALLVIEHGYDQASLCRQLLARSGFVGVVSRCDLAGIERVTGGEIYPVNAG
jgi:release factor glutamine methyltransferase